MHEDKKVLVELIIVLVIVTFGLWSLYKDRAPDIENSGELMESTDLS